MSREITYISNLSVTVNGQTAALQSLVSYANMSGKDFIRTTSNMTTAMKLLDTGDLSSCGVSSFQNTSTENTVELYASIDGDKIMTLLPGETWGPLRLGTNTPAAKTTAGTAILTYLICES